MSSPITQQEAALGASGDPGAGSIIQQSMVKWELPKTQFFCKESTALIKITMRGKAAVLCAVCIDTRARCLFCSSCTYNIYVRVDYTCFCVFAFLFVVPYTRAVYYQHYTNAGGAVSVRTTEREQYNIGVLHRKWPCVFVNQKRENEVTMRWAVGLEGRKPRWQEREVYENRQQRFQTFSGKR